MKYFLFILINFCYLSSSHSQTIITVTSASNEKVPGAKLECQNLTNNTAENIKALSVRINNGMKINLPPYSVQFLLVEDREK